MKRIALFIATNVAVLVVLTIAMQLLGIESLLNEQGTQLDLQSLLIFSAVIGFAGSFISLAISKWSAKRLTGARVIKEPRNETERWLVNTVQRQAQTAGIGTPEVAIYDSPDINAFATGANRNNALVAVSTGLLGRLSRGELEAVLGHEVSHVANGDMVTLTLIQGVVNTFVIFFSRIIGFLVDRLIFRTERGYGPGFFIASIVAQIVLGILASTIVMWFSPPPGIPRRPGRGAARRTPEHDQRAGAAAPGARAFGIAGVHAGHGDFLLARHRAEAPVHVAPAAGRADCGPEAFLDTACPPFATGC